MDDRTDMMKRRLDELRAAQVDGEKRLVQLERQAEELRQTQHRIAGAIQVLEEVLAEQK